ncbi:MAG: hypothetical protein OEU36_18475 [Gammaproteobacteria bacterium]|nr:hypothetical protein [Gammaproteobacteria bacterium]
MSERPERGVPSVYLHFWREVWEERNDALITLTIVQAPGLWQSQVSPTAHPMKS